MINRSALLEDLKRLVTRVESDLLARSEDADVPEIASVLRREYDRARAAKRTADTYGDWREDRITQAAVAWVLSCVFVRFLEDNDLISPPRVSGPGDRLRHARDAHQHFFMSHPRDTDREYLLSIFDELAATPGTSGIFGPHNALREIPNWLSGDKAREVIQFFQKIDANTGLLVHDFTDAGWDTRFLGDLYQDLSVYARKRYALLQTPHFIEQFLLDRTLDPAIREFGLTEGFKMIDPACGSGHLVLGSFARILDRWQRTEPATPVRELVRRTLASVYGVDINPFAVAIAQFRLLLVAMLASGVKRLADSPDFKLNIECGDSLLHVPLATGHQELFDRGTRSPADDECDHAYASEDIAKLKKILYWGQYHAVMANPPYITPKDPGLRDRYRQRFSTCHMKYSLAVPFMEHIFKLCTLGGFTGQLTTNSFMKREFGKKLVEQFFPTVDLTHVIDCSGVYIPGNGTPSVILLGRRRPPVADTVRSVMGINGEPATPADPARGFVWTAIVSQVDQPGSQSTFVSVADTPRATFHAHPWSIGGGGAAELKKILEEECHSTVKDHQQCIGFSAILGEDEAFGAPPRSGRIRILPPNARRPLVEGDQVRDWALDWGTEVLFPYSADITLRDEPFIRSWLWPLRAVLNARADFSKRTYAECGRPYWEYHQIPAERNRTPLSITFAEVATHNHFVLDRGGKVFKQTAPVIKLSAKATEDDHLTLLGVLNSSTACFWMKQVCFPKGGDHVGQEGARVRRSLWDERYAFNSTNIEALPLPACHSPELSRQMQRVADSFSTLNPAAAIARWSVVAPTSSGAPRTLSTVKHCLEEARGSWHSARQHRIALQEELDWQCYRLYGLLDCDLVYGNPLPPVHLGERAFEIVMARRMAAGDLTTTWFVRHGTTPVTDIPSHWPSGYRALVKKRIEVIETDTNIRLIEQPEYKRRWSSEPWADRQAAALEAFLLERLERLFDFDGRMNDAGKPTATLPLGIVSIGGLADAASHDPLFIEAAEAFVGAAGFDMITLVGQLVEKSSIPLLPVLGYRATGLRKHEEWKQVWDLQRKEDAIDARTTLPAAHRDYLSADQAKAMKAREVGDIAVPPKYAPADFASNSYWSLRGKLDVPKERFVSFPFVTGADGQTMIAWAGLDHLQLAKAIGDFYGLVQTDIGGSDDPRLVPLLAALHELLPWIRQWHAGNDAAYGGEPADFFDDFLRSEAAARGMTVAEVVAWQPPARTRAKRAAKKATKRVTRRTRSETPAPTTESGES